MSASPTPKDVINAKPNWDEILMDDSPELLAETLYNLSTDTKFMVRKTEPQDILQIAKFFDDETRQTFRSLDVGKLFEKSLFSLVLTDLIKINTVMAHASFSDIPQDPDINIDGRLWKTQPELRRMDSLNTLFMTFFCCSQDVDFEATLQEILRNTFLACTLVDYIVLEAPSVKYDGSMYVSKMCREAILTKKDKSKRKLIIFDKNLMYPKMKIREGREHDLDDLSPLMTLETAEMEENFNKSYLNDLIAMSDRNNQSVVAEHKSIAVGMLTVTTDINYSMLNNFFQLEPYHGLFKPHLKDELNLAYQQSEDGTHRICKADERKYVTDDYEESLQGSDKNSLLDESSNTSETMSSFSSDSLSDSYTVNGLNSLGASTKPSKKTHVNSHGVSTKDVTTKTSANLPQGAAQNDTIIPMVSSNDDMVREGDELARVARMAVEEDLRSIPVEIVAMYEQLRQGNLKIEDVEGLDDDIRAMFSKLEDMYSKQDNNVSFPSTNLHSATADFSCYPVAIIADRKPAYHGIPNALAIQLCVMDKKYSIRILDLIQGAFLCFPNREYCVITVPFGAPVPSWLQYFVKVVQRKQSLFDRELYVVHRSVFNCRLRVRKSAERDTQKVRKLVDSLYAKDIILQDFYKALTDENQDGFYAFVATAGPAQQSHVIAIIILSDNEKIEHYQVNYNTDNFVYADLHDPTDYAYVHHFVLNPPFRRYAKKILKEVMRHLKKTILFHCVYSPYRESTKMNHQTLLNNLDDWYLAAPRPRINYKKIGLTDVYDEDRIPPPEALDSSEPYALLLHARKFTFDLKAEVTTRIVFVGASNTSLTCIEKLITNPKLNFLHLTLISPHGLPGSLQPDEIRHLMFPRRGGPNLSMDTDGEWFDRAGIHLKVNIVFGKVTSLLREQKIVVVNRKDVVPYDVLVLTVGQQFLRPDFGEVEIVDHHLNEFIENSVQLDEKKREKIKKPLRRHTKKPKNVFVINSEMDAAVALNYVRTQLPFFRRQRLLIHGACLEAYCCLNAMLRMGVSPERIVFIIRPDYHMDWEERRPYKDTTKLRETMLETFKAYNIKVLPNHDFLDWFLDLRTNTVTRVNFATPNESEVVSYSCFAYFGYSQKRITDEFLSALLDAYITFDKGISIGTDFKTNDINIWAAGPCAAYDNKLVAGKYDHLFYSSYEVGTYLAEKLVTELDPTRRKYHLMKTSKRTPPLPQIMTKQIVHYAELAGGWYYMFCRKPGLLPKCCSQLCTCVRCDCASEITTGSTDVKLDRNQRYFRLWLTSEYKVEGMECLSKKRFSPYNLSTLYGAHESLLHNLVERFERGEVTCLYTFFQQPWSGAICHDRWLDFRAELTELYNTYLIDEDTKINDFIKAYLNNLDNPEALKVDANIIRRVCDSSGLKKRIEMRFLDFLRFNKTVLPMYARPDFVEMLIEDRRLSPLMGSRFPPL